MRAGFWTLGFLALALQGKARAAEDLFSVLTLKQGMASAFAHNHLVTARDASFDVKVAGATSDGIKNLILSFETRVDHLSIDDPGLQEAWGRDFAALGVLPEPFAPVSESDRRTMVASMLSESQLDAERFGVVTAKISDVRPKNQTVGSVPFSHVARADVTLHGKTVTKDVQLAFVGNRPVQLKMYGSFLFTEFGIEPYSAYLGAVSVQDRFHIYVVTTLNALPTLTP